MSQEDRLIDRMLSLVEERGSVTLDQASAILNVPKQNCQHVLGRLFKNWGVIERKIVKTNGRGVPTFCAKNYGEDRKKDDVGQDEGSMLTLPCHAAKPFRSPHKEGRDKQG